MTWRYLIVAPWLVFAVYWAIGTLKTRKTVRRESSGSRSGILSLEIVGFVLLFINRTRIELLDRAMFPQTFAGAVMAVALVWIGIAIALWARWHLGQYWSARVTVKEGHQLIRTGPYAHFRHPIYSGLDLAVVGSALAIDEWRCAIGVVLIVAGYWMKARTEERMLAAEFGEAFAEHCRRTGFLIPKF